MNPFDNEVEIRQDTVLGEAEKVECPPVSLFAIMVSSGERSWTASLNKFSKCCGTIPLFPPSEVPFLVMKLQIKLD
jgi:hypothetical protein